MKKNIAVFIAYILVILGCKKLPSELEKDKLKPDFVINLNGWTVISSAKNMGISNIEKSKIGKVVEHPDGTVDVIYGSWNIGTGQYPVIELYQYRTLLNLQQKIDTTFKYEAIDLYQKQYDVFNALDVEIYGKGKYDFKTWGYKGVLGYKSTGNTHYLTKKPISLGGYSYRYEFYLFHEKISQALSDSAFVAEYGTSSDIKYPIGCGKHENLMFTVMNETFYSNYQDQTLLYLYATNPSKSTYNILTFDLSDYIPGYSVSDVHYFPIPSYCQYGEELYFNIITSEKFYTFALNLRTFNLQLKNTFNSTFANVELLSSDYLKIQWIPGKFNTFLTINVKAHELYLFENGVKKSIPTPSIDFSKVLAQGNHSYGDFKYEPETNTIYLMFNGYLFARKL
jgi:hypothetical protein